MKSAGQLTVDRDERCLHVEESGVCISNKMLSSLADEGGL
jgi:hypothetical protein